MSKQFYIYAGIIALLLTVGSYKLATSMSLAQPLSVEEEIIVATAKTDYTLPFDLWRINFETKQIVKIDTVEQTGTVDTKNDIPSDVLFELQNRLLDTPLTYTKKIYLDISPPYYSQLQLSLDQKAAVFIESVDYKLRLTDPPDCRVTTCTNTDNTFMDRPRYMDRPNETGIQRLVSYDLESSLSQSHSQILTRWREENVAHVYTVRYHGQIDWSPDGRYVSFFEKTGARHHFSGIYKNTLHVLDTQTNNVMTVTQGIGLDKSAWLSDSQTILIEVNGFLFSDEIDTIHFRVCDVSAQLCHDTDTGLVGSRLLWKWHASSNRGVIIGADGLSLFSLCVENSLCNQLPMEKMTIDFFEVISMTEEAGHRLGFFDYQWSPNGKLLLLEYRYGTQQSGVIIVSPDSSQIVYHYSTAHFSQGNQPKWQWFDDERIIALASLDYGYRELYRINYRDNFSETMRLPDSFKSPRVYDVMLVK